VTTFNVPNSAGDVWTVFGFDNSSGFTLINEMGSDSSFTADVFAPKLSEVTAVSTPTNDNTSLSYTFSSNEAGTIAYGGSCSSSTTSATADNNTITFNALADGTYSNCKISVTDSASNTSDNLSVSSFTIDTTAPKLDEVTPVTTPTNDNTSLSYIFSSTESGTITYGGSCSSSTNSATAGNNTITFNALAEDNYSNCKISVTDNLSNTSDNLSVSSFTIDKTAPTLENVTIASSNSASALAKTDDIITLSITSSEAIQTPTVSISGQAATVTGSDNITWSATYEMVEARDEGSVSLNIVFIDLAGNAGSAVTSTRNGSAVRFDKTAPTLLDNLTIASNNTLYTTMAKTGDNITLSITSSEAIQTPTVRIAGQNATVTGSDNITWSATYKMEEERDEGSVSLNIVFSDLAGNPGDTVTSTRNGSAVQFDKTKPVLLPVDNVTTPTSDNTSLRYIFSSTEAGTINYSEVLQRVTG
jgi:hypothetical protein